MESLQNRLVNLAEYNVGFKILDGKFFVGIKYREGWTIIKPDNESITFIPDKKNKSVYYYSADVDKESSNLDKIFEEIETVINYNKELEEKLTFFKEKMNELQTLFANTPIKKLRTIKFSFEEPKKETTPKQGKGNKKGGKTKKVDKTDTQEKNEVEDLDKKIEDAIKKVGKYS